MGNFNTGPAAPDTVTSRTYTSDEMLAAIQHLRHAGIAPTTNSFTTGIFTLQQGQAILACVSYTKLSEDKWHVQDIDTATKDVDRVRVIKEFCDTNRDKTMSMRAPVEDTKTLETIGFKLDSTVEVERGRAMYERRATQNAKQKAT
jgi:hypothetical protein